MSLYYLQQLIVARVYPRGDA